MSALFAILIGLSVGLFALGMLRPNVSVGQVARRRVQRMEEHEADPLSPSFLSRVVRPLLSAVGDVLTRVMPTRVLAAVRANLEVAGSPLPARTFLSIWLVTGIVGPSLIGLLAVLQGTEMSARSFALPLFVAVLGLYMPWMWLRRRATARSREIERGLPDAIDLIITNIEAGLGLQASLLTVSERMDGPTAEEFGRAVRDISLGRGRAEAFASMARRSGSPDMRLFARAVAQSEQTGVPIARVLRNHAAEVRERRRQVARERAARVPVKIILPTVAFIFPTLFILILTPIALHVSRLGE